MTAARWWWFEGNKGPICYVFSWDVEEICQKRKFADLQPFMLI